MPKPTQLAAVQAAPVYLQPRRQRREGQELILQARRLAQGEGPLVVGFPKCFLRGYPHRYESRPARKPAASALNRRL